MTNTKTIFVESSAQRRTAARATRRRREPIGRSLVERDHDGSRSPPASSQEDEKVCKIRLAQELGTLAADLYTEGKLHLTRKYRCQATARCMTRKRA